MRKVDESRAANYIRKHSNYKKWLAFVLCLSLLTGTVTLYIMNKPATAMTAEGADSIGAVLETLDSEGEAELIQDTLENKLAAEGEGSGEGGDGNLFDLGQGDENNGEDGDDAAGGDGQNGDDAGGDGQDGDDAANLVYTEETKDGQKSDDTALTEDKAATEATSDEESKEETTEEDELTQDVVLTVSYVDENGESIADDKELSIEESFDPSNEAPSIDGYTFKEATVNGDVITKVAVKKNADDIRYYEVSIGDETKEIKKNATVILTYTAEEAKGLVITASYVDEEGKEIADEKELEISESFDPKKDSDVIEGYTFKEAKIDEDVVVLISAKEDEESGEKFYEATLEDKSTVEIKEDTTVVFSYATVDTAVVLTAKFVDKNGEEIQESRELNIGDETELKKNQITEVEGYFFNKAIYEDKEIVKIAPIFEEEKKDTDKDETETETESEVEESVEKTATVKTIGYKFTTIDGEENEITEDAEIEFSYLKASTETEFTFEDSKVSVKATVNGKNVFPEGIELKATELTKDSEGYNYDAYMEALNENAEAIAQDAGQENAVEYTEDNTLLYDIAFMFGEKELQPAEGSVNISVEFKNNQLSSDLQAKKDEDITVIHLPIKEEIKNADEFTSTKETIDITYSDIEVKTLTDASSELGEVDKVEFEESSFSVFVFKPNSELNSDNTWDGSEDITIDYFKPISSLLKHAVVANVLHASEHIEGSIRVGTFQIKNDPTTNQGTGRVEKSTVKKIVVEKTVINPINENETFQFGFFDGNELIKQFSITTSKTEDGSIKGSCTIINDDKNNSEFKAVFDSLDAGKALHVYELKLDENGSYQRIEDGQTNGNYQVSYSYRGILGTEETEIVSDQDANYIGEIVPESDIQKDYDFFGKTNGVLCKNYVDQDWTVEGSNLIFSNNGHKLVLQNINNIPKGFALLEKYPDLKKEISDDLDRNANGVSTRLAQAKNYPQGTSQGRSESDVVNVINLKSTTGSLKSDLENANFLTDHNTIAGNSDNSEVIKNLISEDQYLLINIAVGSDRDSYVLDASEIEYGGYKNTQDGFNDLSSHIIYNFVGPSVDGKAPSSSYDGTVTIVGNASGLILAPLATVNQNDAVWNGEIIADIVWHQGQEIHEKPITSSKTMTVSITNTGIVEKEYSLVLKKKWKDQDGNIIDESIADIFSPILVEVWRTYNDEDGEQKYEKYGGTITLSSGNSPNKWEYKLDNVPRYVDDNKEKEYKYFIKEVNESGETIKSGPVYYSYAGKEPDDPTATTNCEDAAIALDDSTETIVLVCVNTRSTIVLPSTGGVGDIPYMATGLGTAVAGLVGAKAYNKKKKKDDEEE